MIYEFKGRMTISGVFFIIDANSLEEAKEKAERGQFDDAEDSGAEMIDFEIYVGTGREA
jgi:hypothetical protein